MRLHTSYGNNFTFAYVDDVCTSQETHLRDSTPCYGNNLTFAYVDDVRTSEGTYLWDSTACYRNSFTFFTVKNIILGRVLTINFGHDLYLSLQSGAPGLHPVDDSSHSWTTQKCTRTLIVAAH
jgi:hypothetical protein